MLAFTRNFMKNKIYFFKKTVKMSALKNEQITYRKTHFCLTHIPEPHLKDERGFKDGLGSRMGVGVRDGWELQINGT